MILFRDFFPLAHLMRGRMGREGKEESLCKSNNAVSFYFIILAFVRAQCALTGEKQWEFPPEEREAFPSEAKIGEK